MLNLSISNLTTRRETFVGSSCVEFFDEDMKEVLKLVLGLISTGITGKYKSSGYRGKQRFEVSANANLVKKQSQLKALFNHIPIYQKGNGKWEIQVFTPESGLTKDQSYSMKLKTSRWNQGYGTGITFTVIERQ